MEVDREDGGAHAEKCGFSKSESTQVGRAAAYEYFLGQHPAEFNFEVRLGTRALA
jgi:carotenoid cleavage dioxygenase-like enzyme